MAGHVLAVIALTAALAGCFDNEAEQRKAFITFLQTRVIDRPGVRIANPSDDDIKAFGPYAAQYSVITNFTGDAELTATAMKLRNGLPNLTNVQSVIDNRDSIRKAGGEMGDLLRAVDEKHAVAKTARAALKQPDDLNAVFDKAFDKTVTAPVSAFHESVPIAQDITTAAAKVADYVVNNRDTVKIVGGQIQATNARTQAELMSLVNALSAYGTKYNEAQRKLRIVLTGS